MASRTITLVPREQRLRSLLLEVANVLNSHNTTAEPLVLRWAGGWVRDKLLGIDSHDIDVAINAMTGVVFAEHIRNYCETRQAAEKHGLTTKDVGSLHKVARNPANSKHLETAMVRIFGLDIDFVNLRKETYTNDSRNPQVEFGTASEDAMRRDATINALFYNLRDDIVEDFTNGLADLDTKIIRTPMDPLQTFTDDPLRVLRLVRFASRLGFTIDGDTRRFMANEEVLDALKIKITRERIGVELEKMLKGEHPRTALELIDELGLYHAIFTDPTQQTISKPDISRWPVAYKLLDYLIMNQSPGSIGQVLIRSEDSTYSAWILAAIMPWMVMPDAPETSCKTKALPLVATVARNGFKAPKKLTDVIVASHSHRREIIKFKRAVDNQEAWTSERDTMGMAIRHWDSQTGSWRLQVLSAMLGDAIELLDDWMAADNCDATKFLKSWHGFIDHLMELDVLEAPSLKRLLDGRALAAALGVKPGKWVKAALDVCMAWQLRHPKETDPAGAIDEVQSRRRDLDIPSE